MISIVVPAHNEHQSLRQLVNEIVFICESIHRNFEILLIDDGSTDTTWSVICELSSTVSEVQGIRFTKRFGKSSALCAGFHLAKGSIMIQMDADLQDDPAEIPRFIDKLEEGYDLVVGYKQVRHDPASTVIGSRVYNWVASRLSGIHLHDHNCGFKAYRSSILEGINLYGEMHRHMPTLLAGRGAKITEIITNHRPRKFGSSKYGREKMFKGVLDLMTVLFLLTFRQRPLHFLGGLGMASFLIGFTGLTYLAGIWLQGEGIGTRPLLIYSLAALLLGCQLFATGILAELVTYYLSKPSDTFAIAERSGRDNPVRDFLQIAATTPRSLEKTSQSYMKGDL